MKKSLNWSIAAICVQLVSELLEKVCCWRTLHGSKPSTVPNTEQGPQRLQCSGLPSFCLCTLHSWMLWLEACVSLCRDQCRQHLGCPQELADHAESRQLCRIFVFLAEMGRCFTDMSPKTRKGLQVFITLVFFCSGSMCKSFLWIQVVTVAVETLCFCDISRFVFTVTMENKGRFVISILQMEILGFSRETSDTCRKWAHDTVLDEYSFFGRVLGLQGWALPIFSSVKESNAVLACCPQFWTFRHSPGISPTPVPILWFICSMSDQADYCSCCRCLCLPYPSLYLNVLL